MDEGATLVGTHAAREEEFTFATAPLVERQGRRRLDRLDSRQRRRLMRPHLRREFPTGIEQCGIRGGGTQAIGTIPRAWMWSTVPQVAVHDAVDETSRKRFLRGDQFAGDAHLDRLLDANQPREALRPFRTRDDSEIHFRLPEPLWEWHRGGK